MINSSIFYELWFYYHVTLPNLRSRSSYPIFFFLLTCSFALTFRSLGHFELIFVYDIWWGSKLIFLQMWISSHSSFICWKGYLFHIELSWHVCWKSIDYKSKGLFLHSLLYFIVLSLCLFLSYLKDVLILKLSWLLHFFKKLWNQ